MVIPKMNQTPSMKMQPGFRQIVRMQQANLLQLPDAEFHKLIAEVERSSLFHRLYHKEKLIHYQRFPRAGIYPRFYQLKEEMAVDKGSLDIESLLSNHENIVCQIEKLEVEKFKRFFLFPEDGITSEEIAAECGLKNSEVEAINLFINDFAAMSEFYHPSGFNSQIVHYTKIASIEKDNRGFVISYFSPFYARGRYIIDYTKFEQLLADGSFSTDDIKKAKEMFKKLELINHRKDTINNVLHSLIRKQELYLESGNSMSLLPFTQKELAQEIGLAPSSVSRAIRYKSLVTPWGKELPLKYFLPTPRWFKKELIRQLFKTEPSLTSDEATRAILWEKFGIAVSRRSVAEFRKELKIPTRGKFGRGKEIR